MQHIPSGDIYAIWEGCAFDSDKVSLILNLFHAIFIIIDNYLFLLFLVEGCIN